jgi:hypothetical protein
MLVTSGMLAILVMTSCSDDGGASGASEAGDSGVTRTRADADTGADAGASVVSGAPASSGPDGPPFPNVSCAQMGWQKGQDQTHECSVCIVDACCWELQECGFAIGKWANMSRLPGCGAQLECSWSCVENRLRDGATATPGELIADCVHACPEGIPESEWPMYEAAVVKAVECVLAAPAVVRTDDDAGLLWEPIEDEDGGATWPGGCFEHC